MDFIFMLTRQDQTVLDALDVLAEIQPLGLRHIGFKDVGVDRPTLRALNRAIKAAGATSYMEVVSTSPEAALQSARVAAEIGIDRLLGGTDDSETLAILKGTGIAYYPFPGKAGGPSHQARRHGRTGGKPMPPLHRDGLRRCRFA